MVRGARIGSRVASVASRVGARIFSPKHFDAAFGSRRETVDSRSSRGDAPGRRRTWTLGARSRRGPGAPPRRSSDVRPRATAGRCNPCCVPRGGGDVEKARGGQRRKRGACGDARGDSRSHRARGNDHKAPRSRRRRARSSDDGRGAFLAASVDTRASKILRRLEKRRRHEKPSA